MAATAIAEYVLAAAAHFARGLHEATRQKAAGQFTREGYEMLTLRGATTGVIGLGGIGQEVAWMLLRVRVRVDKVHAHPEPVILTAVSNGTAVWRTHTPPPEPLLHPPRRRLRRSPPCCRCRKPPPTSRDYRRRRRRRLSA